jgi:hypothetical protein
MCTFNVILLCTFIILSKSEFMRSIPKLALQSRHLHCLDLLLVSHLLWPKFCSIWTVSNLLGGEIVFCFVIAHFFFKKSNNTLRLSGIWHITKSIHPPISRKSTVVRFRQLQSYLPLMQYLWFDALLERFPLLFTSITCKASVCSIINKRLYHGWRKLSKRSFVFYVVFLKYRNILIDKLNNWLFGWCNFLSTSFHGITLSSSSIWIPLKVSLTRLEVWKKLCWVL